MLNNKYVSVLRVFAILVSILFLDSNSFSEVITLTSGKKIECKITNFLNNKVYVVVDGKETVMSIRIIDNIEKSIGPEVYNSQFFDSILEKVSDFKSLKSKKDEKFNATINTVRVELYMVDWCGYCSKMESFLRGKRINYVKYNIARDRVAKNKYLKLNATGVPVVIVGDQVIKGYNTEKVLQAVRYYNNKEINSKTK